MRRVRAAAWSLKSKERNKHCPMRFFWRLVSGMPIYEFIMLLNCGLETPKVYTYDHASKSAARLQAGQLIWPVEFLLCCFSRKHILHGSKLPSMHVVHRSIRQWQAKLRWQIALKDNPAVDEWRGIRVKRPSTPWCDVPMPWPVDTMLEAISACITKDVMKKRRRGVQQLGNVSNVCRTALWMISACKKLALPTDKDGGYCLVDKCVYKRLREDHLANPLKFRRRAKPDDIVVELISEYHEVCRSNLPDIDDDRKRSLLSVLMAPAGWSRNVFSKLKFTVKTHKPAGRVGMRGLHQCLDVPWASGIRLISSLLRPALQNCTHILRDSRDLIQRSQNLRVPATALT